MLLSDPIGGESARSRQEEETQTLMNIANTEAQAIVEAAKISAASFDRASDIASEQFEKVLEISMPEIEARRRVLELAEEDVSKPFEQSALGKFEEKQLTRGLAARGLQKSGFAAQSLSDLAAREGERNIQRRFQFAGITGLGQQQGVNALSTLGNTLSAFAIGSGQAQAQGLQSAAFARGQGALGAFQFRAQKKAASQQQTASLVGAGIGAYGSYLAAASDEDLKKNIKPIDDALVKLDSIKGVSYNWKHDVEDEYQAGVIAQDVEKVMPGLVGKNGQFKTVNYLGLIGVLVQAVKELKAEVDSLKEVK